MTEKQNTENQNAEVYANPVTEREESPAVQAERQSAYNNPLDGEGHFIHTYMSDGSPLPSFEGEPKKVAIPNDINEFTDGLWNSLNADNKVSLFVRFIDLATGETKTKIVNKNK